MYEGKGTHLFVPLDVVPSKSNNSGYPILSHLSGQIC